MNSKLTPNQRPITMEAKHQQEVHKWWKYDWVVPLEISQLHIFWSFQTLEKYNKHF